MHLCHVNGSNLKKKRNTQMLRNTRGLAGIILVVSLSAGTLWGAKEEDTERLKAATETLTDLNTKISKNLAHKAVCAIVVPGLKKGGLIVGAEYGRGFASCRKPTGGWTAPAGMRIEGGSFGLQAGGEGSDVVILVMNKTGMEKLLKSKFTLGGDASVAAGPLGREGDAQTDALMHAEMLTWARSHGVFAGISLDGSTMRPDAKANKELYGASATNPQILTGKYPAPAEAKPFVTALQKFSPHKG
jgi:lipid-binding SYLF domain-containing protein